MKQQSDHPQWQPLFRELRDDDTVRAPSFDRVRARSPRVWRVTPLGPGLAVTATAVAVLLALRPEPVPVAPESPGIAWQAGIDVSEWRAPTDFLLHTSSAWQPASLLDGLVPQDQKEQPKTTP